MIIQANTGDLETVKTITYDTIEGIYPNYYPRGAVDFFLAHHREENIRADIEEGIVYLLTDDDGDSAGTVTIKNNEILRLFVLPEYQGRGYGRELMNFAENKVAGQYDEIVIDASLSAKPIYLKRGYREMEYHIIKTDSGDCLCYDVMKKRCGDE